MSEQQPYPDLDPSETREWLEALDSIIKHAGNERAQFVLRQLFGYAQQLQLPTVELFNTDYCNTIPVEDQPEYPGDIEIERRILTYLRWNAAAMVVRAGKIAKNVGGHIASYASVAVLYEVGFHHFFHAPSKEHGGDLIFFQGHSSPGIYARAFLLGRLTEEQLVNFRQEAHGKGLSSYPHPWLMPDFWQFPTVSMGLGPMMAIYQARFLKYLHRRNLVPTDPRKVWAFCGDGEMDEPESLGALAVASREQLDNLIFVINCNLQRLDGPVRGNGKIIQELERVYHGAGWHVIKVLWGRGWDALLAQDHNGVLLQRMTEVVDGEWQNYVVKGGAYIREHFFGTHPELQAMVADLSDEDLEHLQRGGHEFQKVYAAFAKAVAHQNQPTVILMHTVKGFGMGTAGEGLNTAHQQKKMNTDQLKVFRDRFKIPVSDDDIEKLPFLKFPEDSEEAKYLHAKRKALGGYLPYRRDNSHPLEIPALEHFAALLKDTDKREISTTMAFVRFLNLLLKDKTIKDRVVPIVPDECRTFGMEGLFRQIGIYSPQGQLYSPVDASQVMYYHEDCKGQLLQEGINEGGAMASWIAAATSYSANDFPMIPFYIFYSMFGFQRIGDLAWAAGDSRARGFLLGATSGRTTLAGEGLQHCDGHSHLFASVIPNCIAYDPTFSYELAVILHDGLRRMYAEQEDVFYYVTVMNENYHHPEMPQGVEDGIIKGMYKLQQSKVKGKALHVQLLGSGTILREAIKAAEILATDFGISADIWSVTSFTELRKQALSIERQNRLHPKAEPKQSYVTQCLAGTKGPVIAATDYLREYADLIRAFVPNHYVTLGTDGFGRSDSAAQLRYFFEVDANYIAFAALSALAELGQLSQSKLIAAMKKLNIDPDKPDPVTV